MHRESHRCHPRTNTHKLESGHRSASSQRRRCAPPATVPLLRVHTDESPPPVNTTATPSPTEDCNAHVAFRQQDAHEDPLVDAEGAGQVMGVSGRTWRRWDSAGNVPRPIRIGRRVRWHIAELRAWVQASCPPRKQWEKSRRPSP